MKLPLDGSPVTMHAVVIDGENTVLSPYLCDTDSQAQSLANRHDIERGDPAHAVSVIVTVTQVPRTGG